MHYPQCNGTGDWDLVLTARTSRASRRSTARLAAPAVAAAVVAAVAVVAAAAELVAAAAALVAAAAEHDVTENFSSSVNAGAFVDIGSSAGFAVTPGTGLTVVMTGTGDPDLYVKFGSAPTTASHNCRPYLSGASETCTLTVPQGKPRRSSRSEGTPRPPATWR